MKREGSRVKVNLISGLLSAPKGQSRVGINAMQEAAPRTASQAWTGFVSGPWQHEIDVRDFIVRNTRSYKDGEGFLAPISDRTKAVFDTLQPYFAQEAKKGVLDVDPSVPSSITSHPPGHI